MLIGGAGVDVIKGDDGEDTVSYADNPEGVGLILSGGVCFRGDAEGDTCIGVENAKVHPTTT
ncbi:hypothetical protein KXS07_36560 [Inquilinus limosus]